MTTAVFDLPPAMRGRDVSAADLNEARRATEPAGVVLVPGRQGRHLGTVVLAAIDDDPGAGLVLAYGWQQATRLGAPLRAVHVWADRRRGPRGSRETLGDEMTEACHLMSDWLAEHLPPERCGVVERQILHDRDSARALIALSREGALLVVAAKPDGQPGSTVRQLAGHTRCTLAIVPAAPVTGKRW